MSPKTEKHSRVMREMWRRHLVRGARERKGRVEAGGPNCLRSFKHRLLCGGFVRQLLDLVEEKRVRMGLKLFFAVFYHDGVMNTVADSRVRLVSPGNGRRRLLLPSKLCFLAPLSASLRFRLASTFAFSVCLYPPHETICSRIQNFFKFGM